MPEKDWGKNQKMSGGIFDYEGLDVHLGAPGIHRDKMIDLVNASLEVIQDRNNGIIYALQSDGRVHLFDVREKEFKDIEMKADKGFVDTVKAFQKELHTTVIPDIMPPNLVYLNKAYFAKQKKGQPMMPK